MKHRLVLSILFSATLAYGDNYYDDPPWPVCPKGFNRKTITREIPRDRLPKNPRNQGDTPSCGPHGVLDALGITLYSPSNTEKPSHPNEIDPWTAILGYESYCKRPRKKAFQADPFEFAQFILKNLNNSQIVKKHSGKTMQEQTACFRETHSILGKSTLLSQDLDDIFQSMSIANDPVLTTEKVDDNHPTRLNMVVQDIFPGGKEELLETVLKHFGNEGEPEPTLSLVFPTIKKDGPDGSEAHTMNLIGVTQEICKNESTGEEKRILIGKFRNSWSNQPIKELNLSRVAEGMIKYGLGFFYFEKCGENHIPCHEPPLVAKGNANILYHLAAFGDAQGIRKALPVHRSNLNLPRPDLNSHKVNQGSQKLGHTPLWIASSEGNSEVVSELLNEPGIDLNLPASNGNTPLLEAIENNHFKVAKQLIVAGANLNLSNRMGFTPLLRAAYEGNTELVDRILESKEVLVNKSMPNGETPLFMASLSGHHRIVSKLLKHDGITPDPVVQGSFTPVAVASQMGHLEVVKALVEGGAQVNPETPGVSHPLAVAVAHGQVEVVRYLLGQGAKFKEVPGEMTLMDIAKSIQATETRERILMMLQDNIEKLRH